MKEGRLRRTVQLKSPLHGGFQRFDHVELRTSRGKEAFQIRWISPDRMTVRVGKVRWKDRPDA